VEDKYDVNSYLNNYLITFFKNEVTPDVEKALDFYKKHLLEANSVLDPLLREYNFKSKIPSWKWEIFAAILVGDVSRGTNKGSDLENHEVKSRLIGDDFEYQYHRRSWKEKLKQEIYIKHIYISYWPGFADLNVRIVDGIYLKEFFEKWEPEIIDAYEVKDPKQRFRRYIPYATIVELGKLILRIRGGKKLQNLII